MRIKITALRGLRLSALAFLFACAEPESSPAPGGSLEQGEVPVQTGEATAGEARTGAARTGEARTGEARTGEARTGEARTGEARTGEARTGEGRTGEGRTGEAPDPAIVFLGTSLTAGYGVGADSAFPALLQSLIDSAGLPFAVVNAGLSGETSAGGLRRLDWSLQQPVDVLFLELGANDGLRGLDPARMRDNLDAILTRTRERYPDVALVIAGMEAPPNLGEAYTRDFRDVFTSLADEHDAVLIPFLLDGVAGVTSLNQADRIHPNAEGHRTIAISVWTVLEPLLRRRTGLR
jgi:acyl-CoA thioesterase-1